MFRVRGTNKWRLGFFRYLLPKTPNNSYCQHNCPQVGPIQLDALLGEAGWEAGGAGPLHPMMEGDDLLECQLGENEEDPITLVKQERGQF